MQIWLYTQLSLNILLIRMQIKSHMIHFQIWKVTKMKEFHDKEPLYIYIYIYIYINMCICTKWWKCVNSVNLWNWEGLKRKENVRGYVEHFTLFTLSVLVHKNAGNCSKMSKKMIRRFYDIKWVLCFSYVCTPSKFSFFLKTHCGARF